jgi:hypothetical protein
LRSNVKTLTREAENACLCERRRGAGGKQACWAHFETAIWAKHADEGDSLRAPVSTTARYWSEDRKEYHVVMRHHVWLGRSPEATLCTAAEAKAVEQAFGKAYMSHSKAQTEEAETLASDIAKGRSFVAIPGNPTCG